MATLKNTNITGATFSLPNGSAAQQPGSPANGMARWNTSTGSVELRQGGAWQVPNTADTFVSNRGMVLQTHLTNQSNVNTNTGELSCFSTSQELNEGNGFYTLASNGVTVPETGYYDVFVHAHFTLISGTRTTPAMRFYKNGVDQSSPAPRSLSSYARDSGDNKSSTCMHTIFNLTAGDRIGIGFFQEGGGGDVQLDGGQSIFNIAKLDNFNGVWATCNTDTDIDNGDSPVQQNILSGSTIFNEGGYTVASSGITVPSSGLYEMSFQYYVYNGDTRGNPSHRFMINGTAVGPVAGMTYIRNGQGQNEATGHNQYVRQLNAGDEINNAFQEGINGSTTDLYGPYSAMFVRRIS